MNIRVPVAAINSPGRCLERLARDDSSSLRVRSTLVASASLAHQDFLRQSSCRLTKILLDYEVKVWRYGSHQFGGTQVLPTGATDGSNLEYTEYRNSGGIINHNGPQGRGRRAILEFRMRDCSIALGYSHEGGSGGCSLPKQRSSAEPIYSYNSTQH